MRSTVLLFGLLVVTLGSECYAQMVTSSPQVAVYRYAVPGRPTMDIRVWGGVRTPGVYQVELETDLLEVITYAGGPLVGVESDREERDVYVQLVRGDSGGREVVVEDELEALVTGGVAYPDLQDGDIVSLRVETRQRFQLRDAAVFTSSLGTLALVIIRIIDGI